MDAPKSQDGRKQIPLLVKRPERTPAWPTGAWARGFGSAAGAGWGGAEMVVHGDVQQPPGVNQLARDSAVVGVWRGVAARVIVGHDDARRTEGDGEPEHFTRMHERGIEDSPRDFLDGDHAGLGVKR